jgi:hypothetical protein
MSATCFEASRRIAANRAQHAAPSHVEGGDRRAYIGAMTDLTPPEIIAWLGTLRMVWTKCFIDVPDGQGFPADEAVKVTCMKCIAALGAP